MKKHFLILALSIFCLATYGQTTDSGIDTKISTFTSSYSTYTNDKTRLIDLFSQLNASKQSKINTATANYVFAGPTSGSAAAPALRALVSGDIPSLLATYAPAIGSSSITTLGTISTGTWQGSVITPAYGGTGKTSVTAYAPLFGGTTSTGNFQSGTVGTSGQVLTSNGAGALPTFQDATGGGGNPYGYTTTATAAGTTTLTAASTQNQYFTGATTQTVVLPVTSTLTLGLQFFVTNNSSGIVTVNSSGSNMVQSMTSNSFAVYTVILTSGTTAASWGVNYFPPNPGTTVGDIYAVTSVSGGVGIPGRVVAGTSNYALLGQGAGVLPAYGQITSDMVLGATTNSSASAGFIGEDVTSLIASGSATSLTTATAKNITSISLTAGNWNVKGNVNFTEASATVTARSAGISSATATVPTDGSEAYLGTATSTLSETNTITMTDKVIKLSGTTTIYLVGSATFSAGTVTAFGMITATRVR